MRRAAPALLLALACGDAAAAWTAVGGEPKIYAAYVDAQSVRRNGDLAQVLGLYDILMADFSADGQPHQSTVTLREYDCANRRVRLLAFVDYAERMGAGRVISTPANSNMREPGRWEPVVPGATDEAFMRVACGN